MIEDKRVRRTKKLLRQALYELMQQKPFQNITVSDIVRQADINRGTFYVHYQDVYDLKEQIENEMVTALHEIIQNAIPEPKQNTLYSAIKQAVAYLEQNHDIAYVLLKEGSLEQKMIHLLEDCGKRQLTAHGRLNDWSLCFISAGCIGIMKRWMMHPENIEKEQVIAQIDTLLCCILYQKES